MCTLRSGATILTRHGYAWILLQKNAIRALFLADWLTEAKSVYVGLYDL
jgi:hypothetical protein